MRSMIVLASLSLALLMALAPLTSWAAQPGPQAVMLRADSFPGGIHHVTTSCGTDVYYTVGWTGHFAVMTPRPQWILSSLDLGGEHVISPGKSRAAAELNTAAFMALQSRAQGSEYVYTIIPIMTEKHKILVFIVGKDFPATDSNSALSLLRENPAFKKLMDDYGVDRVVIIKYGFLDTRIRVTDTQIEKWAKNLTEEDIKGLEQLYHIHLQYGYGKGGIHVYANLDKDFYNRNPKAVDEIAKAIGEHIEKISGTCGIPVLVNFNLVEGDLAPKPLGGPVHKPPVPVEPAATAPGGDGGATVNSDSGRGEDYNMLVIPLAGILAIIFSLPPRRH